MSASQRYRVYPFLPLFQKFIQDSRTGRRLQPNGKKLSDGTIKNYQCVERLLQTFSVQKGFELRIREDRYLNTRETVREQNYWKKFYKKFTDYLNQDLGYFDNYIGQNIKIIRTFFNYLN